MTSLNDHQKYNHNSTQRYPLAVDFPQLRASSQVRCALVSNSPSSRISRCAKATQTGRCRRSAPTIASATELAGPWQSADRADEFRDAEHTARSLPRLASKDASHQ